jgi:hypothetical protein
MSDPFSSLSSFSKPSSNNTPIGKMNTSPRQQPLSSSTSNSGNNLPGQVSSNPPLQPSSSFTANGLDFLANASNGSLNQPSSIPAFGMNNLQHQPTSFQYQPSIKPSSGNTSSIDPSMIYNPAIFSSKFDSPKQDDLLGLGNSYAPPSAPNNFDGGDLLNLSGGNDSVQNPSPPVVPAPLNFKSYTMVEEDSNPLGLLGLSVEEVKKRHAVSPAAIKISPPIPENKEAPSMKDLSPEVAQIMEMGFSRDSACAALESSDYNLETAVAMLISGDVEITRYHCCLTFFYRAGIKPALKTPNSHDRLRRVSFDSDDLPERNLNHSASSQKIMSVASAVGMQVFSQAKNVFAFGKQKIAGMTGSLDKIDDDRQSRTRYRDHDSDSDDSDDNWFVRSTYKKGYSIRESCTCEERNTFSFAECIF